MGLIVDGVVRAMMLGVMGIGFVAQGVVAFPQRTAFVNSTSVGTATTSALGTGTTPGPSLSRSCGFFFPVEISLNSWWTEHATLTVATEIDYYIQYNNTVVPANSSTSLDGVLMTIPVTFGNTSIVMYRATDLASMSVTGLRAPDRITVGSIPHDLIELFETTTGYNYAMTVFHTNSDISTKWGPEQTDAIVASPTPYVVPSFAILSVAYYDGTSQVSSTYYDDFQNGAYLGGAWPTSTVDWPCQVTFSAIPTDFIDWMYAFPGASSKFPWLSECTDWTRSPPTGAPTVHVVVSTLTHKTSSVIATSPGNFGGVVSSKTERTTSKAVETSRTAGISETKKPSTSEIVGTTVIAIPTTSPVAEQTTDKVTDSGLPSTIEGEPPTTADAPRTTPVLPVEGTTSEVRTTANGAAPVSTNNQVHTGGEFTETQQTGASEAQQVNPTVPNEGSKPVSVPQETSAGQQTATATITAGQSSVGAGDSSESGNPAIVAPVLTFGSTTVAPNSASEYIVSSQTLAPGGPAITFGETTYSLATSATVIVANGQTQPLTVQHTEPAAPQITLGSSIVAQNSDSAYVYGSQTISAGGPAITVGSTTYSLLTSNSATFVIENGVTHPVATLPAAGPTLTLGNSIITANSASEYIINSQTLTAGGPEITVGETTYSLGTADSTTYLVQNGQTPAPAPAGEVTNDAPIVSVVNAAAPAITIGSSIIIQNPASEYILNSQTLAPGGSAIVDKGTTYSLAAPGTAVFVNGATVPISAAETAVLVAGKTLFPNSAIEVSGTTYALPPSGTGLLINGVSSALPTNAPVIATFGSAVATAVSGGYILGSETLVSGAEVTVSGTTYSLVASAVVVNGVTSPLPTQATLPYAYIVGSATLSPGSGVVVSGTTYSISIPTNPSTPPTLLINNTPAPLPSVGLVTVDGDVYTAIPAAGSGVVVGTQTLFPSGTITVAAASGGAETLRLGSQGVEVVGETGVKATSSPGQTGMGTARGTARGSETQTQTGTQTQTQGAAAASTSTSAAVAVKQNDGVVAAGFAAAVMGALLAFI